MSPEANFGRHVVVREIDRATAATVDVLGPIGTATVHEAIGRRGYLGAEFGPFSKTFVSPVRPSRYSAIQATT